MRIESCDRTDSQSGEYHLLQLWQTLFQYVNLDQFVAMERHVTRSHESILMKSKRIGQSLRLNDEFRNFDVKSKHTGCIRRV